MQDVPVVGLVRSCLRRQGSEIRFDLALLAGHTAKVRGTMRHPDVNDSVSVRTAGVE